MVTVLLKMTFFYIFTLHFQKLIIFSLLRIDALSFTIMHILTILTLHNLISMNIFFTIKEETFFYDYKEKTENRKLEKPFKNSYLFKPSFN